MDTCSREKRQTRTDLDFGANAGLRIKVDVRALTFYLKVGIDAADPPSI